MYKQRHTTASMPNKVAWLAIYAFTTFVFFQFTSSSTNSFNSVNKSNATFALINDQRSNEDGLAPPPNWVFSIVWTILYALITATIYIVWNDEKLDTHMYDTLLSLFYANVILNKIWSVLFFDQALYILAFVDALALLLSAISIAILLIITGHWFAFGLFVPYCVWLVIAIILNAQFF
jgi:tryptophan-rich sensory protein